MDRYNFQGCDCPAGIICECLEVLKESQSKQKLKPKRTISLEAYIKMQNDWMISCYGQSFNQSDAKKMVDMILKHNSVEVES